MRRLGLAVFVLVAMFVAADCGGSSSPAAPSSSTTTTTTSSTAPTITGISFTQITAGSSPLTVTVTGTNFAAGLTLAVTQPGGGIATGQGALVSAITATTFQATVTFGAAGTYSFQVTSASGEKSNAFPKTVVAATTWVSEGVRLAESSGPTNITNITGWQTSDGRFRFLVSRNGGIYSVISPDGLAMTIESGAAKFSPSQCGHTRALKLDDGRVRVYCRDSSGILSYISSDDGGTFAREGSGYMITNAQVGAPRLTMGGVVRARDGRWRMYFANEDATDPPGASSAPLSVFSAVSTDLLNWTVEPGVRIGANTTQSGSATHPSAIVNADGSVSIAYNQFFFAGSVGSGMWVATSNDGLTFTRDERISINGADPDIHNWNGVTRAYHTVCGTNTQTDNPICSVRLTGTLSPASMPVFAVPLDSRFRPIR